jgi:hypothetical protein
MESVRVSLDLLVEHFHEGLALNDVFLGDVSLDMP